MRIELGGQAEEVAVERPTQALIRANQDDRTLADFAHLQQRMGEIAGVSGRSTLDAVQKLRQRGASSVSVTTALAAPEANASRKSARSTMRTLLNNRAISSMYRFSC